MIKTLIDLIDGKAEDALDDSVLDHIIDSFSIGVGPTIKSKMADQSGTHEYNSESFSFK